MDNYTKIMKFIRRLTTTDYTKTETVVTSGTSYDIDDLPKVFDEALEVEMDDGSVYVLLGYKRK